MPESSLSSGLFNSPSDRLMHQLRSHDVVFSLVTAGTHVGDCKTLIWEATTLSGDKFHFATGLRVKDRIDESLLHQVLNRPDITKLQMADTPIAESLTGFRSGTIPPFGHHVPLPVYLDEQLISLNTLRTGSGDVGYDLQIDAKELIRFCEATLDISVNRITNSYAVATEAPVVDSGSMANRHKAIKGHTSANVCGHKTIKPVSDCWQSKPLEKRLRDVAGKDQYHIDQVKECLIEAGDQLLSLMYGGANGEYTKTPVHNAAWRGTSEVLDLFVEAGKKLGIDMINVIAVGEGNHGKTPIFYALTRSREEMVDHCLSLGADLLIVNNKGQTPCSLASSHLSEQLCLKMCRIEEEQLHSGRVFRNFRLSHSDSHKYGDLDPRFPIDDANMGDDIEAALDDYIHIKQQLSQVNGVPVGNGFVRSIRKTNEEIRDALASERWGRTPRLKYLIANHQPARKPPEKVKFIPPADIDVSSFGVLELEHVIDAPAEIIVVDSPETIQNLALAVAASLAEIEKVSQESRIMTGFDIARHAWGLDTEWQPKALSNNNERPVAVLQLSSRKQAFIIDVMKLCQQNIGLSLSPMTATEHLLSEALTNIFEAASIGVVGFGIGHDLSKLAFSYPHMPCFRCYESVVDFQTVVRSISGAPSKKGQASSLQQVVAMMLKKRLDKTEQCSDWETRPLRESQSIYGALDAALPRYLLHEAFLSNLLQADAFQRYPHLRQDVRITFLEGSEYDLDFSNRFRVECGSVGSSFGVRLAKQVWPTGKESPPLPCLISKTLTADRKQEKKKRDGQRRTRSIPLRRLSADLSNLPPVSTSLGYTKDSCAEAVLGGAPVLDSITSDFTLRFNRRGGVVEMSNCWLLFVNFSGNAKEWKYSNQFSHDDGRINFSVTTINGVKDSDLSFLYNIGCFDDSLSYVPKIRNERDILLFARSSTNSRFLFCGRCKIAGWARNARGYHVSLELIQYDQLMAIVDSPFCKIAADEERKVIESLLP